MHLHAPIEVDIVPLIFDPPDRPDPTEIKSARGTPGRDQEWVMHPHAPIEVDIVPLIMGEGPTVRP